MEERDYYDILGVEPGAGEHLVQRLGDVDLGDVHRARDPGQPVELAIGRQLERADRHAELLNEGRHDASFLPEQGSQQQRVGVEQIALAMQNINQATVQSLSSTRQAEKSAQSLNELARTMLDTVAQYRL